VKSSLVSNWESSTLRQYSSLDGESLVELIHDPAWSNEGLFALLKGCGGFNRSVETG
jgi:hypothetical protein